jgi:hypothetical protein
MLSLMSIFLYGMLAKFLFKFINAINKSVQKAAFISAKIRVLCRGNSGFSNSQFL